MEELKSAYREYKNYTAEKAKADATLKAKVTELREQIATLNADHNFVWRDRKEYLRTNLDHYASVALQEGHSPNAILLAIGSRNPTWIYHLKNSGVSHEAADTEHTHPLLKETEWDYSDHAGSHGVLRSADKAYFKFYDLTSPGIFCIVDSSLEFVTGSNELYEKRSRAELERMTEMLSQLLDGTYPGKVRLIDNPYTS